ncbi:hypothetical protein [Noviherbaspirillum sp. UKPF54]|uniref:hypothetical protein n=1 Tax=Noviherbaspirillum sp. UKPF54 TaxID=2601898 RepID=UPI0011B15FFC|nr:hypothetical protein [Noviherbaspirillum sp. UKPF54]QDZ27851.1 hypothetical protein FAY22_07745 [Noviherbaspirillum sp. UKPF54]
MDDRKSDQLSDGKSTLLQKLDAVGWGLFLIWMGAAFLTNMRWGFALIGVGVIVLGGQAARRYFQLSVDWFWLVLGFVFAVWGILESLQWQFGESLIPGGLLPVVFIVAGIALVASALWRKSQH